MESTLVPGFQNMTTTNTDGSGALRELRSARAEADDERVAEILDRFGPRLRKCVDIRMDGMDAALRRRIDPADVVQEAVLEALERLDAYLADPEVSVYLWLRFLAIQRLLQLRRFHLEAKRRDVRREIAPSFAMSDVTTILGRLLAGGRSPSSMAARAEERDGLVRAIETLPVIDQEILALRCLEELSNEEAAQVLEMNPSTVSTRFLRALRKVRDAIDRIAP